MASAYDASSSHKRPPDDSNSDKETNKILKSDSENNKIITSTANSVSNISNNESSIDAYNKPKSFYSSNNKGPYGVWLKLIKKEPQEINAYKVGSILYKNYKSISDIKRRSKFNVEIVFKDKNEANSLISDKSLINFNLEAFLPGYRKVRKGLIRHIPIELSEDAILNGCESPVKLTDVRRLKRKNPNPTSETNKWIDSECVVITFEGQVLPSEISLFKVKSFVEPFVNKPLQCYQCFEFGHTSKNCKNESKCIICGELKHTGTNCNVDIPKCANCKGSHKSIDSICTIFQAYHKINVLMAYDNISFFEAKKMILGTNNTDRNSAKKTIENFPTLPTLKIKNLNKYDKKKSNTNESNQTYSQTLQSQDLSLMESQTSLLSSQHDNNLLQDGEVGLDHTSPPELPQNQQSTTTPAMETTLEFINNHTANVNNSANSQFQSSPASSDQRFNIKNYKGNLPVPTTATKMAEELSNRFHSYKYSNTYKDSTETLIAIWVAMVV